MWFALVGKGNPRPEPRVGALTARLPTQLQDSAGWGGQPPELVIAASRRSPFGPGEVQKRRRWPPRVGPTSFSSGPLLGEREMTEPQLRDALRARWALVFW
ncbi:hypothetical protein NDU88_005787 [Pleurodeles waltl]|uniref:Uncharacterized protein n=1 Tax=Pleurodeles waltl TaxID=8319 RepID=A0AAV7MBL4_PLEWA|nr:hypothetical protein NDU88_005787 [Pleurodeles waltl]